MVGLQLHWCRMYHFFLWIIAIFFFFIVYILTICFFIYSYKYSVSDFFLHDSKKRKWPTWHSYSLHLAHVHSVFELIIALFILHDELFIGHYTLAYNKSIEDCYGNVIPHFLNTSTPKKIYIWKSKKLRELERARENPRTAEWILYLVIMIMMMMLLIMTIIIISNGIVF